MTLRYDLGELVTAMVTPMNQDGTVNYDKVEELANYLVENESDAILVAATTGESPTLDHEEELEILSSVKRAVAKRAKIVMNAGSNSTAYAVKYAKLAEKEECVDAILSVVPYYNKPSQEGMYAHFSAVADAVDLPIILYNIPSRTGVNLMPKTIKRLYDNHKNIVGVKQSYPDMDLVSEIKSLTGDDFAIYSGDDSLTLPMLSLGAYGVVSVASHLYGPELKRMITLFKAGKVADAREIHESLYYKMKKLFMAPNPVPVKAALQRRGLIKDYVRKPLVQLNEEEKAELFSVVQ